MADEITVRQFVSVRNGNLVYAPPQAQFTIDLTGAFGPAPGALVATYDGVDVDLSAFTSPALMHIYNQEPDGGVTVSWGVHDPEVDRYYPVGMLAPGDHAVVQLDDLFGGEFYPATGTGSATTTNSLRVKAKDAAGANVFVGVFER